MHGDFSRWFPRIPKNQVGILAQEGRILLDADVNAHALLGARWQDLAARAAFGAGIAAIPADALDGWKVVTAQVQNGNVVVSVMPGIAWADGLLVELDGNAKKPVSLIADPFGPPIQPQPDGVAQPGTRDAVVLEVWRRALNGFQVPAELIEPALGGPDTAERMETAYALRLYRMADGDTCRSIIDKLRDDLSTRGRLTATLAPTTMTAGDCPVVQGGGYTGFEHDLYRIEIAETATGAPMFKWSQWNGGLVGRGVSDGTKLSLRAGDQAIQRSGLTTFYLEALVFDADRGHWKIACGMRASLDNAGEIDISGPTTVGQKPPTTDPWVVRIWNDLRPLSDFPSGAANELGDGIRLEFDANATYVPGDYWTFAVRAGGLDNPSPLLDHAAPFGIHHHRVPLAELHWTGQPITAGQGIEDCRVPLHPVTANDGCCTYSVGNGIDSHGDYSTIQAAINALPDAGGRVCVLPGEYRESVTVKNRQKVEIIGCGPRSHVIAPDPSGEFSSADPGIYVLDTSGIRIEGLSVTAGRGGVAILLEADAAAGTTDPDGVFFTPMLEEVVVAECEIRANFAGGIEMRGGQRAEIRNNHVVCPDLRSDWAGITVGATDVRIERNTVTVENGKPGEYAALGGIWLRGGSTRVDVLDNTITGGAGHGVMLGHVEQAANSGPNVVFVKSIVAGLHKGFVFNGDVLTAGTDCVGCGPGTVVIPPAPPGQPPWVAGDPLHDIRICNNTITEMGLSAVGVMGFFLDSKQGIITVDHLDITGNRMIENVARQQAEIDSTMAQLSGFGAVSLAYVNELTIRDNEIAHNGNNTTGAMVAIFVFHAEGAEISRNKIYSNGPSSAQHDANAPHGGIWLNATFVPGRLAAAIRDNDVQTFNGPALFLVGNGHWQVTSNSFSTDTSQAFLNATNVIIQSYSLLNGLTAQPPSLVGLKQGALKMSLAKTKVTAGTKTLTPKNAHEVELAAAKVKLTPAITGIDIIVIPPPGSVVFSNNTCVSVPTEAILASAVVIQGLADIAVEANHFEAIGNGGWFMPSPVVVNGGSVRVQNNRFTDQAFLYSLFSHGLYNVTTGNILDHCVLATAPTPAQVVNAQNLEVNGGLCNVFGGFHATFGLATEVKP